jgi:hypothetical protein
MAHSSGLPDVLRRVGAHTSDVAASPSVFFTVISNYLKIVDEKKMFRA